MDWPTLVILIVGWSFIALQEKPWRRDLPTLCLFLLAAYTMAAIGVPQILVVRTPFLAGMGALALIGMLSGRSLQVRPTLLATSVFLVIVGVASSRGGDLQDALLRWIGLVLMVMIAAYFFLSDPRWHRNVVLLGRWLMAFGVVYIVVFLRYLLMGDLNFEERFAMGEEGKATGTAGVAFAAGLAAAAMALRARKPAERRLLLAAWGVAQLAILATGTRGALIVALLLAPFVLAPQWFRHRFTERAFGAAVVMVILIGGSFQLIRSTESVGGTAVRVFLRLDREDVFDTRRSLWEEAMRKGMERPLLGRGLGSSSIFHQVEEPGRSASGGATAGRKTVHSQFLEVFYESGAVGLAAFLAILALAGLGSLRWLEFGLRHRHGVSLYLSLSWIGGLIGMLTHGGMTTTGNSMAVVFWITTMIMSIPPGVWAERMRSDRLRRDRARQVAEMRQQGRGMTPLPHHGHRRLADD